LDKIEVKTTVNQISKEKNNHIEVKGGQDIVVNEAVFSEFKDYIIKVRQDITGISSK